MTDRTAIDGLPCACRFRGVEGAIKRGTETGVLVDPDEPVRECALHKALRERVAELEDFTGNLRASRDHADQKTEAAERRIAALETTLEFITNMEGQDGMTDALFAEKTLEIAHITLASVSATIKESAS